MDALTLLTTRYSLPRLTEPAPMGEALDNIKRAALQAPDHGNLRPWRFIIAEGREALLKLGDIFVEAAVDDNPTMATELLERARQLPLRAPMVIVCIAKVTEHPKIPVLEQHYSAACAVMAMQQAAFAQGFGGIWRTGTYSQLDMVKQALALGEDDEIVGFLYLGTPSAEPAKRHPVEIDDHFSYL
ncbi:NAD(P)H nitroreductase [Rheinheimera salexigens]|uniref:Putative NAD(P)H nitroreductase n=1 Tax=Rheinheimera salexigens TaxID=1628148 RepID=A0A1E7Q5Z0_9GAMM|nr:NAD(P)H nitroreductase [Rheinheimera salexigens]OEY69602.1 nitroreductase [Rheinheimera salexigens]